MKTKNGTEDLKCKISYRICFRTRVSKREGGGCTTLGNYSKKITYFLLGELPLLARLYIYRRTIAIQDQWVIDCIIFMNQKFVVLI